MAAIPHPSIFLCQLSRMVACVPCGRRRRTRSLQSQLPGRSDLRWFQDLVYVAWSSNWAQLAQLGVFDVDFLAIESVCLRLVSAPGSAVSLVVRRRKRAAPFAVKWPVVVAGCIATRVCRHSMPVAAFGTQESDNRTESPHQSGTNSAGCPLGIRMWTPPPPTCRAWRVPRRGSRRGHPRALHHKLISGCVGDGSGVNGAHAVCEFECWSGSGYLGESP